MGAAAATLATAKAAAIWAVAKAVAIRAAAKTARRMIQTEVGKKRSRVGIRLRMT